MTDSFPPAIPPSAPPAEDLLYLNSTQLTLGHGRAIFGGLEKLPVTANAFFLELIDDGFGDVFKVVRSKRKDLSNC